MVTKNRYLRALALLPKLREAEAIVKTWTDGIKACGPVADHMEVVAINDDGSCKLKPKEKSDASSEGGREAA